MKLSVDFISFAPHEPLIVQLARTKALNYCLSLQNYMGLKEKGKRDLSGKLAWIILNMRHVAYVFMFTMQTTRQREANQSTATDHKSSLLNAGKCSFIMIIEPCGSLTLLRKCKYHHGSVLLVLGLPSPDARRYDESIQGS